MDDEASMSFDVKASDGSILTGWVSASDWHLVQGKTWHTNNDGYVLRYTSKRVPGKKNSKNLKVYLTAELFGFKPGERGRCTPERPEVNHMDRDKLNCRRSNLEVITHSANMSHWQEGGLYGPDKDYL